MISRALNFLESVPGVGWILSRCKYPLKRLVRYHMSPETRREWGPRIEEVLASSDNQYIPRAPLAGRIEKGLLVMHNGLRIVPESYYGEPMRLLLEKNRGVHEPQEERVFMEVLKWIPPGALMVELGAYWGFYSMWFSQQIQGARCFLVEPDANCLEYGKRNFACNQMSGTFLRGMVGAAPGGNEGEIPSISVDVLVAQHGIERIHILHADIQGAELEMLAGAAQSLAARKVDYIFISTHSQELHEACRSELSRQEYLILADADMRETFSFDGLIVARRCELKGLMPVAISKKTAGRETPTPAAK